MSATLIQKIDETKAAIELVEKEEQNLTWMQTHFAGANPSNVIVDKSEGGGMMIQFPVTAPGTTVDCQMPGLFEEMFNHAFTKSGEWIAQKKTDLNAQYDALILELQNAKTV